MEIFLDSADMKEIERWLEMGILDGVTTNPTIMVRDGIYDFEKGAKEIAELIKPRPLSVEVVEEEPGRMIDEAHRLSEIAENMVIKIPQLTTSGRPLYDVMRKLEEDGIRVNATLALSPGHVVMSAKAGATYISVFMGRIADEGGDPGSILDISLRWLDMWDYDSKIIAASIRGVPDFITAMEAGAPVITAPPDVLRRLVEHKNAIAGVRKFLEDARKAMESLKKKS